jgi:hypothetical protein
VIKSPPPLCISTESNGKKNCCRVRVGRAPLDKSALEKSIREYTEKLGYMVIDLCLGTMFDSLGEAYDFDNLYSWESCLNA